MIHVSPKTKEILDTFGTFELFCRGEVTLKVRLHWLITRRAKSPSGIRNSLKGGTWFKMLKTR